MNKISARCISKRNKESSFLDYWLPLLGILQYYSLGSTGSYGSFITYAYVALLLILNIGRTRFAYNKGLFIFIIYAILSQPIVFSLYGGFNSARLFNYLTVIYIFVSLCVFSDRIHWARFLRCYSFLAYVSSAFIVLQAFQVYVLGQKVMGMALLPCDTSSWYDGGDRPCGLFPEPSVYAFYVLPLIYLKLKKNQIRSAIILTASVILSTSSLGIFSLIVIWVWFLFVSVQDIRKASIYLILIIFAVIIAVQTPMGQFAIGKIIDTDYANSPRLTRGWFIFANLSSFQQLFGIGFNNLLYFIQHGLVQLTDYASTIVSEENIAYVTSVYGVMIGYGALGWCLYFLPFVKLLKDETEHSVLIFLFLILSLAQTMFFNMNFLFYLAIVFNLLQKNSSNFGYFEIGQKVKFIDKVIKEA